MKSILGRLQQVFSSEFQKEERLLETLYIIMKEFGYTIEELKSLPIPTFQFIIKMLNKEAEEVKRIRKR